MHLKDIQLREESDSERYFPGHGSMANLEYLGVCLAGEVGEICGWIKSYSRGSISFEKMREELAGENPDVLIYLVMLSAAIGRDLEDDYIVKKEYNDRRYGSVTDGGV